MPEPKTPTPRSFSPWWALLLLIPVAPLVGHLIGSAPVPPAATSDAALRAPVAPSARTAPAATVAPEASAPQPEPQAQPQTGGSMHWLPLDQAFTESDRTHKPILLEFTADWCPSCQKLAHECFESPAFAGAIDDAVIPVAIVDRAREQGQNPADIANLEQKFGVTAFPTLVVLMPSSGKVQRVVGAGTPAQARDWIVGAADAVK